MGGVPYRMDADHGRGPCGSHGVKCPDGQASCTTTIGAWYAPNPPPHVNGTATEWEYIYGKRGSSTGACHTDLKVVVGGVEAVECQPSACGVKKEAGQSVYPVAACMGNIGASSGMKCDTDRACASGYCHRPDKCQDNEGWVDLEGDTCQGYAINGWCAQYGGDPAFAVEGDVSANQACCNCRSRSGVHHTQMIFILD